MERIEIKRLGLTGDGIAEHQGKDVYVPFTLPGEVVSGRIAEGRMVEPRVERPSKDRIPPICGIFGTCGGCALQHGADAFLAEWKAGTVERALAARGLSAPVRAIHTSPANSRRRAVFSGRRTKKTTVVGFHQRASGDIVPVTDCDLVRPEIVGALPVLHGLTRLGASRRDEIQLQVTCCDAGLDISVTEAKPADGPLLVNLASLAADHDLARLTWNGDIVVTRRPPVFRFGNARVAPPPGAFLQATEAGEAVLINAVRNAVGPEKRVADLFAGCGTFSLSLASMTQVHAVENDPEMLAALTAGWRAATALKPLTQEARDLFRRPLLASELAHFDAVVVDPPRAGAEAQCRELAVSPVARIAAVSCNPVTFARDAAILCDAGFAIKWLDIIDQFRWSGHVEMVALLSR